jgi:four helix bundle protein
MKRYNILQEKSYAFALDVLQLIKELRVSGAERILLNQLVKSGTSIGANVEEAIGAQSDKDFLHKVSISYKEARETKYWLNLLKDLGDIKSEKAEQYIEKCEELLRILGSIKKRLTTQNS